MTSPNLKFGRRSRRQSCGTAAVQGGSSIVVLYTTEPLRLEVGGMWSKPLDCITHSTLHFTLCNIVKISQNFNNNLLLTSHSVE